VDRVTPDGRVRVYETRDAGATWQPRGDGLPQDEAYLTVLREAFDWLGQGDALELYFGATSGTVFGSGDAGATWTEVAGYLPPVYSVSAGGQLHDDRGAVAGGESSSKDPSRASTRSRSPSSPVPAAGSAPPTPSSRTSRRTRASSKVRQIVHS